MSISTEKEFQSTIRKALNQYLQAASQNAENRMKLFCLAWDLTMGEFGTRETLYERFFFGDPMKMASQLYHVYL